MKDVSVGNRHTAGQSTLELLMAMSVLVLSTSAAVTVVFGSQSLVTDTEIANAGISLSRQLLEQAHASGTSDFSAIVFGTSSIAYHAITLNTALTVDDVTACKKQVTSTVMWQRDSRQVRAEIATIFTDVAGSLALGGDCPTDAPSSTWANPQTFASDNFNPGKPTAIDALDKVVYMGGDKTPYFFVADTRHAHLGQSHGLFVPFANGFVAPALINDIDVAAWQDPATGAMRRYAYAAINSSTNQLAVIDVTDIANPVLAAERSLPSCVGNSYPQGWRIYFYNNLLYMTTRETAGPELHIFDVSVPTNPIELGNVACRGVNLNTTVNSMIVRDQLIDGIVKRIAYLATTSDSTELRVLDVTDPIAIVAAGIIASNQNLPGNQDGESVYLIGRKLYFGRQSAPSGPDLYIFDTTDPFHGLSQLGAKDIGTGATSMVVSGHFAFIGTPKTNEEFQVWNITNLNAITKTASWNFPNIIENGLDYEPEFVYACAQGNDALRMIYSP